MVALPMVLAALLCAYELANRSLWLDEAATVSIASQHGHALWSAIAHDGGNMLVYYLLLHGVIAVFGDGETAIRLPSLLGTAVSAGLTTMLGLRLFERRLTALTAGVLFAVSLPTVFWGQDARGYALMVTFGTAAFLAFVELLRTPAGRAVSRSVLVVYTASTVIALYIGYDAVLLIPAQLVILWAFQERARVVLSCLAVAAICCLPLAVLAITRGSGQLFWVPPLTAHVLGQSGVTLLSTGMPPNFHPGVLTTGGAILSLLVVIAGVVVGLRAWGGRGAAATGSWRVLLCVVWVLVPCGLGLVAAMLDKPIELARCAVLAMPAIALLSAWVLLRPFGQSWTGRGWVKTGLRIVSVFALIALFAVRAVPLAASYGVSPEDWQAATAHVVDASARDGACVMFYPQDGRMPFDYYVRHGLGGVAAAGRLVPVLPDTAWGTVRPYVEQYSAPTSDALKRIVAACPRLWLVSSHEGQSNGPRLSGQNYIRYQRLVSELGWVYPHQKLAQFGYAATVYTWQLSRTPIG